MSHTWMSHIKHMNVSCHTHKWVMSHTGMSHFTHRSESCHVYGWVMSHVWSLANMVSLVLEILETFSSQIDQSGLLEIWRIYTYICRRTLTHAHTDTNKLCKSGQSHQICFAYIYMYMICFAYIYMYIICFAYIYMYMICFAYIYMYMICFAYIYMYMICFAYIYMYMICFAYIYM